MRHQRACFGAALIVGLVASLATISLAGQSQTPSDLEAKKEAERSSSSASPRVSRSETPRGRCPRTSRTGNRRARRGAIRIWPGVYSNSDESGIPFERPAQFEGRRLEDITPAELDKLRQQRRDAVTIAPPAPSRIRTVTRSVLWENLNASNSRAWLVVDPPDGRIPPMTPEAQKRAAARAGGTQAQRPRTGRLRPRTAACTIAASRAACRAR